MKKYIKIALLFLVVVGIVTLVAVYLHILGAGAEAKIAIPSYERTVAAHVENHIKGKPYAEAQHAFDSISTSIATQATIILSDGEPAATPEEITHSKQYLFDGYAPVVNKQATDLFAQSSWNSDQLRALQTQSQRLLAMGVAESGTDVVKQLNSINANVNDYFAALALVASASHCSSVAAAQAVRSGVARYKRAPLSNNTSLVSALNAAPNQAKNSCANALVARANAVCNYYRYSSYVSFAAACDGLSQQINAFNQSLGRHAALSSALARMERAKDEALGYFAGQMSDANSSGYDNSNDDDDDEDYDF